jgi:hypothetical protein
VDLSSDLFHLYTWTDPTSPSEEEFLVFLQYFNQWLENYEYDDDPSYPQLDPNLIRPFPPRDYLRNEPWSDFKNYDSVEIAAYSDQEVKSPLTSPSITET